MASNGLDTMKEMLRTPGGKAIAALLIVGILLIVWNIGALGLGVGEDSVETVEQPTSTVAQSSAQRSEEVVVSPIAPAENASQGVTYEFYLTDADGYISIYNVGGKPVTQVVEDGDELHAPETPKLSAHEVFSGWYVRNTLDPVVFGKVDSAEKGSVVEVVGDVNTVYHARLMNDKASADEEESVLTTVEATAAKGEKTALANVGSVAAKPSNEDERFTGWSLEEEAESAEFQPGVDAILSDDVTLYPVFDGADASGDGADEPSAPAEAAATNAIDSLQQGAAAESLVAVRYDAGVGSDAPDDDEMYEKGASAKAAKEPQAPKGMAFTGWRLLDKNGEEKGTYRPGQKFKIKADCIVEGESGSYVQLVASYVTRDVVTTISYDANGGKGKVDSQKLPVDALFKLSDGATLSREGYVLVGWSLSDGDGNKADFDLEELVTADNDDSESNTLYAVWEPEAKAGSDKASSKESGKKES